MSVTSAADNGSHKEGQVAVVQLQGVEACGKLEFGLHHVAKWPPEALEELSGDEASTTGHQEAVFVHAGGQEGEEGFVNAVLQEGHLKGKVRRPQHDSNVLGYLCVFCVSNSFSKKYVLFNSSSIKSFLSTSHVDWQEGKQHTQHP